MSDSASGGQPHEGRSIVTLQPERVSVLVGTDVDGKHTFGIECYSPVARYRFVMPSMTFLEFGVKVMEAIVQSLKAEKKGR